MLPGSMDISSLEDELQRKRSELAKLQEQVIKAQHGRKSQKSRRTRPRSSLSGHQSSNLTLSCHSAELQSATPSNPGAGATSMCKSACSSKQQSPEVIPSTCEYSEQSEFDIFEELSQPLGVEQQSQTKRKRKFKALSQAGSLVRRSQDPHSPIWVEGLGYPAQYLVRQTRSMTTKLSAQADGKKKHCEETSFSEESMHHTGNRNQGTGLEMRRCSTSQIGSAVQRSHPSEGLSSAGEIQTGTRDFDPFCRSYPISANSTKEKTGFEGCTNNTELMRFFPQLSPSLQIISQRSTDFFLPDDRFQMLKLKKLQSVHEERNQKRKLKSHCLAKDNDPGSSQLDFSPSPSLAGSSESEASVDCRPSQRCSVHITHTACNPVEVHSSEISSQCWEGKPVSCCFVKTGGSGITETIELQCKASLPCVSEPNAACLEQRSLLVVPDGNKGLLVAVVCAVSVVVFTLENSGVPTPTAKWKKNAWTSRKGELYQVATLLCCPGVQATCICAGGVFQDCCVRLYGISGKVVNSMELKPYQSTYNRGRCWCTSALCSWMSEPDTVAVVAAHGHDPLHTPAVGIWKVKVSGRPWSVVGCSFLPVFLTAKVTENCIGIVNPWSVVGCSSLPVPEDVKHINSLNRVEQHELWSLVVGVGMSGAFLWNCQDEVLLTRVALGCSGVEIGVEPLGLAAVWEEDILFLLLGCKGAGREVTPFSPTRPPWLLAVNAKSVTEGSRGKAASTTAVEGSLRKDRSTNSCLSRLVQTYDLPPTEHTRAAHLCQYCCSKGLRQFAMALSANSVTLWSTLCAEPCGHFVFKGSNSFSIKAFYWLAEWECLFLLDQNGTLLLFYKPV